MAFTDTIRSIPYAARSAQATGYLPPTLRAMGHILYLTGCLADENVTVSDIEAIEELQQAREHWNGRAPTDATSTAINEQTRLIGTALEEAVTEYEGWDDTHRVQNLRDLANRIVGVSCALDRELLGLTGSDPGSSL